jgi:tetratricopeptide (TPR) repeat protein
VGREIALLEKVVRTEPQNTQAWYVLSLARFANGDTDGQMEALDRVIELDPAHAGARLGMGIGKAITGDLDGAATELAEAARGNRNGNMASIQGFIASMQDDSRAVSYLEEAVADQTLLMRWQTQTQLATLAMEEGRFQDALTLLEDARALNPASDTVRYLRGLSLYGLDLQADAQVDFDAVSVRGGAHATDALVLLADTQLALSQLDLAHGTIEKALSAGAGSASYHTVRGRVAAARNDLPTARNAFNRAINKDRDYAPAWLERGLLFIRRNADSEGIRDLQRYLEILGDDTNGTNAEAVRALVKQLQGSGETPSAGGRF